uniref:EF-hand domain-containing protein n=1 Tax=Plectus sambesii TaxID=2011161 RepID=A0A914VMB2_9BILA
MCQTWAWALRGNGKIGEEEYTAFLKRREEEYQNELREGLQQTLKDFDKNEDGKLEEEEIVQLLAATRNLRPKASFKPAFAELDSDNDGGLNVDELEFFLQHTPWNLLEEIPSSEMMS